MRWGSRRRSRCIESALPARSFTRSERPVRYNRRKAKQRTRRATRSASADARRDQRTPSPEDHLLRINRLVLTFLVLALLAVLPARAQLTIEIVGGAGTAIPISVVPFENESTWPLGITGIVGADLTRSGLFRL